MLSLQERSHKRKIVVIGGGASGMVAAGRAAELGSDVVLLERMPRLGSKLRITGKGRCNITNTGDLEQFIRNYGRNGRFLYNCFSKFFNNDLVNFFEKRGVKTIVERGKRVFPESSDADEVVNCLIKYLEENKVTIKNNFRVTHLLLEKNRIVGVLGSNKEIVNGDAVILATGGMSYPQTGSTGDGYGLAQEIGHKIIEPKPGLVPLEIEEEYVREMQGLTLENVELTASLNGRKFAQIFGDMLFTHFGVSGPIVLTMSRDIVARMDQGIITLSINFKPALTGEMLEKRMLREFGEHGKMTYKNMLKHFLPNKAINVFVKLSKIREDKRCGEITREERYRFTRLMTDFRLTVKGPRPIDEAIVTTGGVALDQINPHTMESKIVRNLFFCGEVIDVDGNTGGYNLQAAFSTGFVAGESAACAGYGSISHTNL